MKILPFKIIPIGDPKNPIESLFRGWHPFCTIKINGKKANALIDTGASITCFNSETFSKFSKATSHNLGAASHSTTSKMDTSISNIKKLTIGGMTIQNVPASLISMQHFNIMYEQYNLPQVDAIIGMDVFFTYRAMLDFGTSTIYLNVPKDANGKKLKMKLKRFTKKDLKKYKTALKNK